MKKYIIEVEPGAYPTKYELETMEVLVRYGDVRILCPINFNRIKTPDIVWLGLKWEIKMPTGVGKYIFHNILSRAARQSENVIIDLRHSNMPEYKSIREISRLVVNFRKIKRIKIVTKRREVLDIK